MSALLSAPVYLAAGFFAALFALLIWFYRRGVAHRRIAKGLRSYTDTGVLS
jgi:hypothetical protein